MCSSTNFCILLCKHLDQDVRCDISERVVRKVLTNEVIFEQKASKQVKKQACNSQKEIITLLGRVVLSNSLIMQSITYETVKS